MVCFYSMTTFDRSEPKHSSFCRIGVEQDGNLISQRLGEIKVLQAQTHTQLDKNFKQIEGKVQEQSTVLSCVFSKIETIAATTYGRPILYRWDKANPNSR
jgi:hypothetical protein